MTVLRLQMKASEWASKGFALFSLGRILSRTPSAMIRIEVSLPKEHVDELLKATNGMKLPVKIVHDGPAWDDDIPQE